jgi:dihydropteroate synthase
MTTASFQAWLRDADRPTLVMGVLNVTPDSFSDGGKFADVERAVQHAREMVADGATMIDIGGESTRPGSSPVPEDEQIRRVVPVIQRLSDLPAILSIDTTRARVAAAALEAGASLINDISAGVDDSEMFPLAASRGVPIVLMHRQGSSKSMQDNPVYADVTTEVTDELLARSEQATAAGIASHNILWDVGIGFGKTLGHNLQLLRDHARIAAEGFPMLLGTSRKSFIGKLLNEPDPNQRLFGTAASIAWGVSHGAAILRVHDVKPMWQVVQTIRAIERAGE